MKIDVLGVQAFVAVADCGSFNQGASSLSITPTALTRRLQNLEAALGVRLVERTTRSVALTVTGAGFLPRARHLLAEMSMALREIRESGKALQGNVSMACVPTVGVQYLPAVIQEYSRRYPSNRIKILDRASQGVAEAVLRREAEFGITIAEAHFPELDSVAILQDRFALVCRADHAWARRRSVRWRQLEGQPLIVPGAGSSNRPLLDVALGALQVPLLFTYEVQRSATAVGLVAQGVGMAIVPRLSVQRGSYPGLRMIALTEPVVTRSFVLISRKGSALSPAAQALYDLIRAGAKAVHPV